MTQHQHETDLSQVMPAVDGVVEYPDEYVGEELSDGH